MSLTRGHEMVAEIKKATLKEILRKAWKSGSDASDEGVIPEHIEIQEDLAFGPYKVKDGTVQIPQDELDLQMNTSINGFDIKLGTIIHVEIKDPPIDSARFFNMNADITVSTPIRVINEVDVYAMLENVASNGIVTSITSGNPISGISAQAIEEYVHKRFKEDTFQKVIDPVPVNFGDFNMDIRIEMYDDENDPARKIGISFPDAGNVELAVPVYMRFYNITGTMLGVSLLSPMGITAVAKVKAPFTSSALNITADFTNAEVDLEGITAAPNPVEGSNYNTNKFLASFVADLDQVITNGFKAGAKSVLTSSLGLIQVDIPQLSEIEDFISNQVLQELKRRKKIFIWRPDPPDGSDQDIKDINNQSIATALAIGINAGTGANLPAISDFIPASRDFAVGLSKDKVLSELNKVKNETYPSFPHTFPDKIEGKTVKLNSLSFELRSGAIGIKGDVTVVDAILGSINVDADFDAEVVLKWKNHADGSQTLEPELKGEPDVDLDLLAWILSFLLGFITFGIVGGIIAIVVIAVVENVATKIGATVAEDEVTGQLKVLSAWPQNLDDIGSIDARFSNPVLIQTNGIIFAGKMDITSKHEQTLIDAARSNGPYSIIGNQLVQFNGGADKADTAVHWDFADGNDHIIRKPTHRYGKAGLYVSKFKVSVLQDGGVSTRHFAQVLVQNVAPLVSLPPDFTINEGEVFSFYAHFSDENWLDTHSATVYFGDNTKAIDLKVVESHEEPMGKGEVCISHAYCDDGDYTLRLVVRDDQGGRGEAEMQIKVLNVNPKVKLPERINTLVGQSIRLTGEFTDAGWCDSHIGFWDTGDCTKIRKVVITEIHEPPMLEGTAEIVHIFERCGRFENILRVIDDDNGHGEARMIVNANHVKNPDMKLGFHELNITERIRAVVANDWHPYFSSYPHIKGQVQFLAAARQDITGDGQWAQEIALSGAGHAGIWQRIAVNAGWTYELTAFYHLPVGINSGKARLGIDPLGDTNADAPQVIWVEGSSYVDWINISLRARANRDMITLFLDVNDWKDGENEIRWDNVKLYQIQPCDEVSTPVELIPCLNFEDFMEKQTFTMPFDHLGYHIQPKDNTLVVLSRGEPAGIKKLAFDTKGVQIKFPDYTRYVKVLIAHYDSRLVRITLLKDGDIVMESNEIIHNEAKELIYTTDDVNEIVISPDGDKKFDTLLTELCIEESKSEI